MTVSSAVKNRLDNLGEGKQSLLTFTGVDPLKAGSQCPWIGSLESISTSSLTTRMAGPGIRVRVAPPLACHLQRGPELQTTGCQGRPQAIRPPNISLSQQQERHHGSILSSREDAVSHC